MPRRYRRVSCDVLVPPCGRLKVERKHVSPFARPVLFTLSAIPGTKQKKPNDPPELCKRNPATHTQRKATKADTHGQQQKGDHQQNL
jgi:hypothetical protein